jgi:branched-chain amino acid transport system permease protein
MIFGIMNIANFAHGELYMIGGFFAYYIIRALGVNYFLAMVFTVVAVVGLGVALERMIFARLRDKPIMSSVLATIGLAIFLENAALIVWGPRPEAIPTPLSLAPVRLGPIFTTEPRLFAVLVTVMAIICTHVTLQYTRIGKATRATFQNKEAAALVGIEINRIRAFTFGLGAGLAALAGVLLGSIFYVHPSMGGVATLKAFVVVILGGMGSFIGSIAGGLILGISESFGAYVSSAYKDAIGFILVIIILLYRPQGLFGKV